VARGTGADLFAPFGQIGRDLAAVDWSATPLGDPDEWPPSLRNIVRLQLGSRFAMWMAWGPELTFLCNDAYRRDTLGAKYPWALGRPAADVWAEIWSDIGPRIESVIATGVATWDEDLMLFLERSGYTEETYHTFSYSPLTDDDGNVAGMLCVVSEETGRVIGERRMRIVRDLGTALAAARTEQEVCLAAGRELSGTLSLPFIAGYLFGDDRIARIAFTSKISPGHPAAPAQLETTEPDPAWPVAAAAKGEQLVVSDLDQRFADLPTGLWDVPPHQAVVVPFKQAGTEDAFGFMVAAVNPYRRLDDEYRGFIELAANQVAAAITRARAYEQERQRAEDLAELDRAKTTFFTNVSHELRTPLTLLLGPSADALEDQIEPLPDVQRRRIEVVQRNAERLLKLVNMLLDFSRMESGRIEAQFEPLDLARYTADLAQLFESAVRRGGLAYTVKCDPLPERVHVDREMWAKIVLNLVSNALKATFDGEIAVRLRMADDGGAELQVSDTGIGISPAEQERLFERFHRVRGAALRSHEGSGIGLALVAELAQVHGGTVTVRSEAGVGSTFTVRIPLGTDHLPSDQVLPESDDFFGVEQFGSAYVAEADRWLAGDEDGEDGEDGERAHGARARQRVLVVDDNADMRSYVADLLRDDYSVVMANDGVQALELAREEPPDLVLTDVMMPRLDGFGLLAGLRSDARTMHVPIVMLSARSGEDAAIEGLEAGADDYLVKPFSARELRARVRANLELDRVRRVADELARNRVLLDQAEELAHVGSWQVDLADGSMTASPELYRIVGTDPSEAGQPGGMRAAAARVVGEDIDRARRAFADVIRTREAFDLELGVTRADGNRLVRIHGVPVLGTDGTVTSLRGSVQDVTEQRRAEQAIAASAAAREVAAREHEIADELQRSLLPLTSLPIGALSVFGFYRSGVEDTQAGGDWYDVIDVGNGRTALVIGDVMGRGVRAAAVMGQLRATVRAYARIDLPPQRVLSLLDQAVLDLGNQMIVTCVYAIYDENTSLLTYGNAGHMPPLVLRSGESARRLTVGDPPLGTGCYGGHTEEIALGAGDLVALYTDGLVEHRGSDLDEGIDRAAELLASSTVPWEGLPVHLADSVLPTPPDDDVAILVAALPSAADRPTLVLPLPRTETAVGLAREAVAAALGELGDDEDLRFAALLAGSELVTNAIRYGSGAIELRVRRTPATLVIEVLDGEPSRPQMRDLDPGATNGRGLHLVAAVVSQWGARPTGTGKAVWCEIALPPQP
jgi:signal transduction histidine kinase/DNA-binding response OmpR family regulator